MISLLGFTPDLDPATPGAVSDCEQVIPSEIGMKAAPAAVSVGLAALASECRGAVVTRNLSGNRRLLAGTASKLYEAGTTAWTDVSSSTAGYTLGTDDRWSFCQFGNAAIAATITNKVQRSTSGAFSNITAAPKAQLVESVLGFVVAAHTDESTYGDSPDRWWCCAYLDETDWTPSVATQATTGRLIEGGGKITAWKRLGDDIVAYKQRALFLGRYAGPPEVWRFTQITSDIGCVGQDAVINIGNAHIMVGEDDIYSYDGVRPVPISQGVRQWFIDNRDPVYAYRTQILWDRRAALAWIFFPSNTSAGALDLGLVYHTKSGRWGKVAYDVEAVINYISPSITYDSGTPLVTTYDASPAIAYDSPYWVSGTETPGIFETDHVVKTLSGEPGTSSFTTGDMGDEDAYTVMTKFQVRYKRSPSTATAYGYTKDDIGTAVPAAGQSAARDDGAFDMRQSARWHRVKVQTTGACEWVAVRPKLTAAGNR